MSEQATTEDIGAAVQAAREFAYANGIDCETHGYRFQFTLEDGAYFAVGPCRRENFARAIRDLTEHVSDLYRRGVFGGKKLVLAAVEAEKGAKQ